MFNWLSASQQSTVMTVLVASCSWRDKSRRDISIADQSHSADRYKSRRDFSSENFGQLFFQEAFLFTPSCQSEHRRDRSCLIWWNKSEQRRPICIPVPWYIRRLCHWHTMRSGYCLSTQPCYFFAHISDSPVWHFHLCKHPASPRQHGQDGLYPECRYSRAPTFRGIEAAKDLNSEGFKRSKGLTHNNSNKKIQINKLLQPSIDIVSWSRDASVSKTLYYHIV